MLWTALLLGLGGSVHCLGMCGPLALALPSTGGSRTTYLMGRLLYNLGRTVTYAALGALFGAIGKTFALAGAQRWVSIAVGVLILLAVFVGPRLGSRLHIAPLQAALTRLKRALGRLMQRHSVPALFGIGILNGFLPCGLVYIALAAAAGTGNALEGLTYMACFGLGTVPLMLAVSLTGGAMQWRLQAKLRRAIPLALVLLAAWFILRGLGLGIPYLSPRLDPATGRPACCH